MQFMMKSALAFVTANVLVSSPLCFAQTASSLAQYSNIDVGTRPSAAALDKAQRKLANASAVAAAFASRATAEGLRDEWRVEMIAALMQISETKFAQIQQARTVREALASAHLSGVSPPINPAGDPAAKALGDSSDDLTFIPLASPCRIVDTRLGGAGGAIAAGGARNFTLGPTTTQGSSSCTPFTGFAGSTMPGAVAANITAIGGASAPAGAYLQAYAIGGSSATSWLNFGPGEIVANQGILPIGAGAGQLTIIVSGPADVVVDIFGSFIEPAATALDCVNSYNTTPDSIPVKGFTNIDDSTIAACPATYTGINYIWHYAGGTGGLGIYDNSYGTNLGLTYTVYDPTLTGQTMYVDVGRRCCRVPGR